MPDSRPRTAYPLLAALILLAGFALRVIDIRDDSLWSDETFTVFFAQAPAGDFLDLLLADGVHVPLYFTLMRAMPLDNDLLLRVPSMLLGVGGIALLMWVARRLYDDPRLALWAGALLAFNPYHIWFSRMARPYTLFFVVALLASYYFLALLRGERSTANWLAFAGLTAAAYMTHFFAAALPLAQYAVFAFALRGNRGMLRRWLLVQIVAFIPLAWWIYRLGTQDVVSFGIAWIPDPSPLDPLITVANLGAGFDGTPRAYFVPALIAVAAGVLPGIRRAWCERRRNRTDLYWLWLVLLAVIPVFAISLVRPIYADRYFIVCQPAVLLLMLRGWQDLGTRGASARWRYAVPLLAGVLLLTGVLHVALMLHREDNERQAWDRAAATIATQWQPGDAFVMEPALGLLPVLRYWDDEEQVRENLYEPGSDDIDAAARLWAVYPNPRVNVHRQGVVADFDPFQPDSPMGRWLNTQREQVIRRYDFNGVTVLLIAPQKEQ